jgi:hypothetical protein
LWVTGPAWRLIECSIGSSNYATKGGFGPGYGRIVEMNENTAVNIKTKQVEMLANSRYRTVLEKVTTYKEKTCISQQE